MGWGHWNPCCYSLSCLPKVSIPCLSSGISSSLCLHLCWSPGQVATSENLCIGPLNGSLCLQPSFSGGQQPCCFSPPAVICILFGALVLSAVDPSLWFKPHSPQRDPISCLISLWHCHLWAPNQPSRVSTTLLTKQNVLKLILLSFQGYKSSLSLFSC